MRLAQCRASLVVDGHLWGYTTLLKFSFWTLGTTRKIEKRITGWWFGTFFIFPYIGKNHPN